MSLVAAAIPTDTSSAWRHPSDERRARREAWQQAIANAEARQHVNEPASRRPSEPLVLWHLLIESP